MKKVMIILSILIVVVIFFIAYYGGFATVKVKIKNQGGELIVYKKGSGDYKNSSKLMDEVYYLLLNDKKIETYKGFGKYFDNPKKIKKEELRYWSGCIVNKNDVGEIDKIKGGLLLDTIEEKKYITAEFPYKNKVSVVFSLLKVYSALNNFAKQNGYDEDTPVIEIYDIPNNTILYRKEIISK